MATFTPGGLIKPALSDPASVIDVNRNAERADLYGMGAFVVNDDTFPSNPWEGMKVYKALYQELYVWSTLGGNVPAGQWWLIGTSRKIAYTPVLQNINLGTGGSVRGQYFRVGHNGLPNAVSIHFRVQIALGTGGSVGGTLGFGIPGVPEMWTAGGTDLMRTVGHAICSLSASPGFSGPPGILVCTATTVVGSGGETQQLVSVTPDGDITGSLWAATVPHTWAANSNIWVQGHYWPDQNGVSWGV